LGPNAHEHRLRVVVRAEEAAAILELGVANVRRLKTSDLAAPGWRAITRLLRPLESINAGLDIRRLRIGAGPCWTRSPGC
jgi:hypothetical protein